MSQSGPDLPEIIQEMRNEIAGLKDDVTRIANNMATVANAMAQIVEVQGKSFMELEARIRQLEGRQEENPE